MNELLNFIVGYIAFLTLCGLWKLIFDLPIIIILDRFWFAAMVFGPFLIIRRRDYSIKLLNHEYIHYVQQVEMGFLFAYVWYLVEYLCKLAWYRSFKKAYYNVSFEREAYIAENVVGYISYRPYGRFIKFVVGIPGSKLKKQK